MPFAAAIVRDDVARLAHPVRIEAPLLRDPRRLQFGDELAECRAAVAAANIANSRSVRWPGIECGGIAAVTHLHDLRALLGGQRCRDAGQGGRQSNGNRDLSRPTHYVLLMNFGGAPFYATSCARRTIWSG